MVPTRVQHRLPHNKQLRLKLKKLLMQLLLAKVAGEDLRQAEEALQELVSQESQASTSLISFSTTTSGKILQSIYNSHVCYREQQ